MTANAESSMMHRYRAAKEAHPGMLLLFRMGDFYEAFDDDARTAADLLGLTLTTRDRQVPMAGFPHHQLENYLQKLLRAGQRVAVCDQVEPTNRPAEVTCIVTTGTTDNGYDEATTLNNADIVREAEERYSAFVIIGRELPTGTQYEAFHDNAEAIAPLIGQPLLTEYGVRRVIFPPGDILDFEEQLHQVNSSFVWWDTSKSDDENWAMLADFFSDDEPAAPNADDETGEIEDDDELAEEPTPTVMSAKPCLRCGDRLHPRCSKCKMCAPCCWCPKPLA